MIGHPAWWFDPTYLKVKEGKKIRIRNDGGRTHYVHGGRELWRRPGPVNQRLADRNTSTDACAGVRGPGGVDLPGGARDVVEGLTPGNHKFQCCIHPWMRTLVKVEEEK